MTENPLTFDQHLMVCVAEECDEVGQRIAKALRFGLNEVQPGQGLTNAQRISGELTDLLVVARVLMARGIIPPFDPTAETFNAKMDKILTHMPIGQANGVLES